VLPLGSCPSVFFNYAGWESFEHFKRAFSNPEFQEKMKDYPPSAAASPHLVRKVAVPSVYYTELGSQTELPRSSFCAPNFG
jgi:hypothetical protein